MGKDRSHRAGAVAVTWRVRRWVRRSVCAAAIVALAPAALAAQERQVRQERAPAPDCRDCDSLAAAAQLEAERTAQQLKQTLAAYQALFTAAVDSGVRIDSRELARLARQLGELQVKMQIATSQLMQLEMRNRVHVMQQGPRTTISIAPRARGWLGVEVSSALRSVQTEGGVQWRFDTYPVVETVDPGSPAARAGIVSGDVLVAIDNHDLREGVTPFPQLLRPGRKLSVLVRRNGSDRQVEVTVGRQPPAILRDSMVIVFPSGAASGSWQPAVTVRSPDVSSVVIVPQLSDDDSLRAPHAPGFAYRFFVTPVAGAELVALDRTVGQQYGVRDGLLVTRVGMGTPAARADLRPGDVIVRAGGARVSRPADLQVAIRDASDRSLALEIIRKQTKRTVQLRW